MRAGRAAVVVALVLATGCTGGDGGSVVVPTTAGPAPASTAPPAPTTTVARPEPGTVSLRVTGLTLPAAGAGGSGLRVLVDAATPRLSVRRSGGAGAVTACPAAGPTGPADASGCVDVGPQATVTIPAAGGVEVRAAGMAVTVEELSVTYVPATRATTVVTPARPAGACAASPSVGGGACEATYALVPGGAGPFALDGDGSGGRPRLVLTAVAAGGSVSNRMLASVEGGGSLSIRATLEAGSEARLLHQEEGPGPVAPLTAKISWP